MDFSGKGRCTCGKELKGAGGSFGSNGAFSFRTCSCGIKAMFYSIPEDHTLTYSVKADNSSKVARETKDKLLKIFEDANIVVLQYWDVKNQYYGDRADWLLVKTKYGLITIGWRKRVITIDWGDTKIKHVVSHDVTKGVYMCHAWSYAEAKDLLKQVFK